MMPELGISSLLLQIESAILAVFLLFALHAAWVLRLEPETLLPRSRSSLWIVSLSLSLAIGSLFFYWRIWEQGEYALLAIELPLIAAIAVIHPSLGLGTLILMLLIRPWELVIGADLVLSFLPRFAACLAIFGAGRAILASSRASSRASGNRRIPLAWGPGVLWVLGFSSWAFISILKATPRAEAFSAYFEVLSKPILVFLIALNSLKSERDLGVAVGSLVCGAVGIALLALVSTLYPNQSSDRILSFGALADPNDISAVMILMTPFFTLPLLRKRNGKNPVSITRIASFAALLLTLILLYLAESRGALLAFLVMTAAYAALKIKNRRTAILAAVIAAILFAPLTTLFHRSVSDLSESSESRIIYWEAAARMALHNPVLGVGYGGYPGNFDSYAPRFLEYGNRTAHSSWFLVLGEMGPIGLLLFFGFCAHVFRKAWKMRKTRPEFLLSALGYGVAMSFLSHSYTLYPYLLGAIILAAARMEAKRQPGQMDPSDAPLCHLG